MVQQCSRAAVRMKYMCLSFDPSASVLWAKMLQQASPITRMRYRDARLSLVERENENVVGTFIESTAGSACTSPVDDTVNGALALRSRVAVRASVFDERSEASGLEIIPTSLRSQLELPLRP